MSEQYLSIARKLIAEIESGQYERGGLFPRRNDLSKRFSVSRSTVDRSMRLLMDRGLIEARRGAGTYVTQGKAIFRIAFVAHSPAYHQTIAVREDVSRFRLDYIPYDALLSRARVAALGEYDGVLFHLPPRSAFDVIRELSAMLPCVVVNRHFPEFNYVSTDHTGAIRSITEKRLAETPEARPVFLSTAGELDVVSEMRSSGFVGACRDANRFYEILPLPEDFERKVALLDEMRGHWEGKGLILVSGALANTGAVMAWARGHKLRWQKDIFYSDFDNNLAHNVWGVKVTSFLQDIDGMSARGLQALSGLIRGEITEVRELVTPQIVMGET